MNKWLQVALQEDNASSNLSSFKNDDYQYAADDSLPVRSANCIFFSNPPPWLSIFRTWKYCDALCDMVTFVQFKKRKKHPWLSPATLLKVTLLHGCFLHFLNCKNDTKLLKASYILKFSNSYFTINTKIWSQSPINSIID